MKKLIQLSFLLSLFYLPGSFAQVLCVYCYHQNAPLSPSVNNFLSNGGFEDPSCTTGSFCPASSYYACDIPSWTCTGGGSSTYAQVIDSTGMAWYSVFLSMVAEGGHAIYMGNYYSQACSSASDDVSCLDFTGCTISSIPAGYPISAAGYGGTAGVSIEQTVTGLLPGYVYVLEFWTGGEYDGGYLDGVFAVDVGFGNVFLPDTETNTGGTGIRYIVEFAANSSSHTIKFTNWGHCAGFHTELILDDVKLYRLPELSKTVPHCTTTGTELLNEDEESAFVLYPNPSYGSFSISLSEKNYKGNGGLQIFDLAGRCVYAMEIRNWKLEIRDVNLLQGIYFVKVKDGEREVMQKLIIQ
jgi:hypothetical protein